MSVCAGVCANVWVVAYSLIVLALVGIAADGSACTCTAPLLSPSCKPCCRHWLYQHLMRSVLGAVTPRATQQHRQVLVGRDLEQSMSSAWNTNYQLSCGILHPSVPLSSAQRLHAAQVDSTCLYNCFRWSAAPAACACCTRMAV